MIKTMIVYFFIVIYLCLVFSYIAYKTENFTFAYILLVLAGLNLIGLTILWIDGGDYNVFR
jgi:hypothetical protein